MGALIAEPSTRGEFEDRLKASLKAITEKEGEIIYCSLTRCTRWSAPALPREPWTASNMLKAGACARRTALHRSNDAQRITRSASKRMPPLERRFQPVYVKEPSVEDTISHPSRTEGTVRDPPRRKDQGHRHHRGSHSFAPVHFDRFLPDKADRPYGRGRFSSTYGNRQHACRDR